MPQAPSLCAQRCRVKECDVFPMEDFNDDCGKHLSAIMPKVLSLVGLLRDSQAIFVLVLLCAVYGQVDGVR